MTELYILYTYLYLKILAIGNRYLKNDDILQNPIPF